MRDVSHQMAQNSKFKFKIQNNFIAPYTYMYIVFFYNKVNNSY